MMNDVEEFSIKAAVHFGLKTKFKLKSFSEIGYVECIFDYL